MVESPVLPGVVVTKRIGKPEINHWRRAVRRGITGPDGAKIRCERIEDRRYEDSMFRQTLQDDNLTLEDVRKWDEIERMLGDDQHFHRQSRPLRDSINCGKAVTRLARHGSPTQGQSSPISRKPPHNGVLHPQAGMRGRQRRSWWSNTAWKDESW